MRNRFLLIIISVSLAFFGVWLSVAHVTKNTLVKALSSINDDNIKIFYHDISVSGFPFEFVITFSDPSVKFIDSKGIRGFRFDKVKAHFDLPMRKLAFKIENDFFLKKHSADGVLISEYKIQSDVPVEVFVEFDDSLFKIKKGTKISQVFSLLNLGEVNFRILREEEVLTDLQKFSLKAQKLSNQDNEIVINYNISSSYINHSRPLESLSFGCNMDISRHIGSSQEDRSYFNKLELKDLRVSLDKTDAYFSLLGILSFSRQKHASGILSLVIENYPEFVQIIADGGIKSKDFLNYILRTATNSELEADSLERKSGTNTERSAKFALKFTEDAVYFGNIEMNKLIMDALNG